MIRYVFIAGALAMFSTAALAADCSMELGSDDAMKFDTASIEVPASCDDFTINLVHTGVLDKKIMGHNVVVTKTADLQATATDGGAAGMPNNYVKPDDARVIAFSEIIGGGESTSLTFPVSKLSADEDYSFFCSFPGHWALMKGTVKLVD